MFWMTAGLTAVAAIVALPVLVIVVQVAVALLPIGRLRQHGQHADQTPEANRSFAVLVPAHNEAIGIRDTIASISAQLTPSGRIVVVADNCSDATAQIARDCGAEVLERNCSTERGKGYALQAGLVHLAQRQPVPEFVIVVDADCRLEPECLNSLVAQAATTGRPAQACYLMTPPAEPRAVDVVSALAVLVKNRIRPLGMARLGLPCLITGSGTAFPWATLQAHPFDGGNLVEDMQLAVDLALSSSAPSYCDEAVLSAALPNRPAAFISQRRRWEHGHLQTLVTQVPRLALAFLKTGRIELAAMLLDLSVPPLSLVVALNLVATFAGLIVGCLGAGWEPAFIGLVALALLTVSVCAAWWRFAPRWMAWRYLLGIPAYVLRKLPIYASFISRRESAWVRTSRGSQTTTE
jgi:cellulose synthase/poly-beta-1,6-N-acetylglucosamine synthase-like glycosyltransferase